MAERIVNKITKRVTRATILPLWIASWVGLIAFSIGMWSDIKSTVYGLNQSGIVMFDNWEAWVIAIIILVAQVLSGYAFFGLVDFNAGSDKWKLIMLAFAIWFAFFCVDSGTDILFRTGGDFTSLFRTIISVTVTLAVYTLGSEIGWSFSLALLQEINKEGFEVFLEFLDQLLVIFSGLFGIIFGVLSIPFGYIWNNVKSMFGAEQNSTPNKKKIPQQRVTTNSYQSKQKRRLP